MVFHKSWDSILTKIDLDPKDIRHSVPDGTYSKKYIIDTLQRLHAEGQDLSGYSLQHASGTTTLYARAISQFGSYHKALRAAGINPALYSNYALFNKTLKQFDRRMKIAIKRPKVRQEKALSEIRKEFGNVISVRYNGSWNQVLEAYGIFPE